jgi:hypothetical protein
VMVITFITFVPFHSGLRVLADQKRINVRLWHKDAEAKVVSLRQLLGE